MANEREREREMNALPHFNTHVPISFVWHDLFSSWVSIQITLDPIPVNLSVCLVSISSLWLFYKENCKYVSCVSIKSGPVNTTVGWPKRICHSTRIVDTIFTIYKSMCTLQQDIQVLQVRYNKNRFVFIENSGTLL